VRPSLPALLGLSSVSALGLAAYAVTVRPLAHNFGNVAVQGRAGHPTAFTITVPAGHLVSGASGVIGGPDAVDFGIQGDSTCSSPISPQTCTLDVEFTPKSLGAKVARLIVTDGQGGTATASLTGTAVAPACTNRVVFCNYGHFYSGTFNWTSNLTGPGSSSSETVSVTVIDGVATCNGSATSTSPPMNNYPGRSTKGAVTGIGLFAVEFVRDTVVNPTNKANNTSRLVYRVTVACPSPSWPATVDGPATPSRPAELGDFFQQSYNQPATAVGMDLVGSISYPAPEVDALNGVNGAVQVNWSLKHK
jgi:hypothetical protein